jgi:hypothetical protein
MVPEGHFSIPENDYPFLNVGRIIAQIIPLTFSIPRELLFLFHFICDFCFFLTL